MNANQTAANQFPQSPTMRRAVASTGLLIALWGAAGTAQAVDAPAPGKVVVSGTVPDESTRQAVLTRAREVFGVDRVVDQIGVANLVAPPNWSKYVQSIISPELKQVSRGQININGNVIDLKGEVGNEAVRQQIVGDMSTRLNSTYTVNNGLRVGAAGQDQVDLALANRTIEFETGNATLTGSGRQVLDLLAPVLLRLTGRNFEVTGHTDALGSRPQNIALSAARADAVKRYLMVKGVAADSITTAGVGPDRPLASNDTSEGRSRNRRIELRVVK
jgi:OmpA-OmpF porin, OOP family